MSITITTNGVYLEQRVCVQRCTPLKRFIHLPYIVLTAPTQWRTCSSNFRGNGALWPFRMKWRLRKHMLKTTLKFRSYSKSKDTAGIAADRGFAKL